MAKQSITLKIAGKSYPLDIESGKEEAYRLAEREVNSFLVLIQQRFPELPRQDYLALAALNFAITNISLRRKREVGGEDLQRLAEIERRIDAYLNAPEQ